MSVRGRWADVLRRFLAQNSNLDDFGEEVDNEKEEEEEEEEHMACSSQASDAADSVTTSEFDEMLRVNRDLVGTAEADDASLSSSVTATASLTSVSPSVTPGLTAEAETAAQRRRRGLEEKIAKFNELQQRRREIQRLRSTESLDALSVAEDETSASVIEIYDARRRYLPNDTDSLDLSLPGTGDRARRHRNERRHSTLSTISSDDESAMHRYSEYVPGPGVYTEPPSRQNVHILMHPNLRSSFEELYGGRIGFEPIDIMSADWREEEEYEEDGHSSSSEASFVRIPAQLRRPGSDGDATPRAVDSGTEEEEEEKKKQMEEEEAEILRQRRLQFERLDERPIFPGHVEATEVSRIARSAPQPPKRRSLPSVEEAELRRASRGEHTEKANLPSKIPKLRSSSEASESPKNKKKSSSVIPRRTFRSRAEKAEDHEEVNGDRDASKIPLLRNPAQRPPATNAVSFSDFRSSFESTSSDTESGHSFIHKPSASSARISSAPGDALPEDLAEEAEEDPLSGKDSTAERPLSPSLLLLDGDADKLHSRFYAWAGSRPQHELELNELTVGGRSFGMDVSLASRPQRSSLEMMTSGERPREASESPVIAQMRGDDSAERIVPTRDGVLLEGPAFEAFVGLLAEDAARPGAPTERQSSSEAEAAPEETVVPHVKGQDAWVRLLPRHIGHGDHEKAAGTCMKPEMGEPERREEDTAARRAWIRVGGQRRSVDDDSESSEALETAPRTMRMTRIKRRPRGESDTTSSEGEDVAESSPQVRRSHKRSLAGAQRKGNATRGPNNEGTPESLNHDMKHFEAVRREVPRHRTSGDAKQAFLGGGERGQSIVAPWSNGQLGQAQGQLGQGNGQLGQARGQPNQGDGQLESEYVIWNRDTPGQIQIDNKLNKSDLGQTHWNQMIRGKAGSNRPEQSGVEFHMSEGKSRRSDEQPDSRFNSNRTETGQGKWCRAEVGQANRNQYEREQTESERRQQSNVEFRMSEAELSDTNEQIASHANWRRTEPGQIDRNRTESRQENRNNREPFPSDRRVAEQWQADRNKAEPGQPNWNREEPGKAGWNREEPGKASWNKEEPGHTNWNSTKPGQANWNRTEPGQADWNSPKPGHANWNRAEPGQANWNRTVPGQVSWNRSEPGQADWNRVEPIKAPPLPPRQGFIPETTPSKVPHLTDEISKVTNLEKDSNEVLQCQPNQLRQLLQGRPDELLRSRSFQKNRNPSLAARVNGEEERFRPSSVQPTPMERAIEQPGNRLNPTHRFSNAQQLYKLRPGEYTQDQTTRHGEYPQDRTVRPGEYLQGQEIKPTEYIRDQAVKPEVIQSQAVRPGEYPQDQMVMPREYPHDQMSKRGEHPHGQMFKLGDYPQGHMLRSEEYAQGQTVKTGEHPQGRMMSGVYPQGQTVRPGEHPQGYMSRPGEYPHGQTVRSGEHPQGYMSRPGEYPHGQTVRSGGHLQSHMSKPGEYPQGQMSRPEEHPQGQTMRPREHPQGHMMKLGEHPQGQISRPGEYAQGHMMRPVEYSHGQTVRSGEHPQGQMSRPGEYPQGHMSRTGGHPQGQLSRPGEYPQSQTMRPVEYQGQTMRPGENLQGHMSRPGEYPQGQTVRPGVHPEGQMSRPGEYPQGHMSRPGEYPQGHVMRPREYPQGHDPTSINEFQGHIRRSADLQIRTKRPENSQDQTQRSYNFLQSSAVLTNDNYPQGHMPWSGPSHRLGGHKDRTPSFNSEDTRLHPRRAGSRANQETPRPLASLQLPQPPPPPLPPRMARVQNRQMTAVESLERLRNTFEEADRKTRGGGDLPDDETYREDFWRQMASLERAERAGFAWDDDEDEWVINAAKEKRWAVLKDPGDRNDPVAELERMYLDLDLDRDDLLDKAESRTVPAEVFDRFSRLKIEEEDGVAPLSPQLPGPTVTSPPLLASATPSGCSTLRSSTSTTRSYNHIPHRAPFPHRLRDDKAFRRLHPNVTAPTLPKKSASFHSGATSAFVSGVVTPSGEDSSEEAKRKSVERRPVIRAASSVLTRAEPSPTSADYLLPRESGTLERRKKWPMAFAGEPDPKVDDMAFRRLVRPNTAARPQKDLLGRPRPSPFTEPYVEVIWRPRASQRETVLVAVRSRA